MGRRFAIYEEDNESDWTEEEIQAMMAAKVSKKSARLENNLYIPYDSNETNRFESLEGGVDEKDMHELALERLHFLCEAREWEELVDLSKVQIIMEPEHKKLWRGVGKIAARAIRRRRPRIVRFFLLLLKIIAGMFAVFIVAVIIEAIFHH